MATATVRSRMTDRQRQILRLLARRITFIPIAMLGVISISFGIVHFLPGDPVVIMAGDYLTEAELDVVRAELGRDRPLGVQFRDYLTGVLQGDLGTSYFGEEDVRDEALRRLPGSMELVFMAFALALTLGLVQGSVAAYFRRRFPDTVVRWFVTLQQATPDFVFALLFIYVFFFLLGWAPAPTGRLEIMATRPPAVTNSLFIDAALAGEWATLRSAIAHAILPALSLMAVWAGPIARIHRGALATSLASNHVEYARACGLPERRVVYSAFVAARTPVLTYSAIIMAGLIGGGTIVELIFGWNGFSAWGVGAIFQRDLPVIQGFVLITGIWSILIYVLVDILVFTLDPRVKFS